MTLVLPARVLLLALGAAVLGGCGSSGDAAGGTGVPPSRGNTSSRLTVPPDGSSALPPPSVVTPVPGTRERVARWRLASVSGDGRTLLLDVEIGGPPCDVVTAVDVAETADEVQVKVHAGRQKGARCASGVPAVLGTVRVAAHLHDALGSRRVAGG